MALCSFGCVEICIGNKSSLVSMEITIYCISYLKKLINLVPKLRMSGTITSASPYAFMAWTRTSTTSA